MTAAHPLLPEDFQDEPMDDACLARMGLEERALAEAMLAEDDVSMVTHAEVMAKLEAGRRFTVHGEAVTCTATVHGPGPAAHEDRRP